MVSLGASAGGRSSRQPRLRRLSACLDGGRPGGQGAARRRIPGKNHCHPHVHRVAYGVKEHAVIQRTAPPAGGGEAALCPGVIAVPWWATPSSHPTVTASCKETAARLGGSFTFLPKEDLQGEIA